MITTSPRVGDNNPPTIVRKVRTNDYNQFTFAEVSDAPLIHDLMRKAFAEYKDETPISSALDETIQSISAALEDDEQALIGYVDGDAVEWSVSA